MTHTLPAWLEHFIEWLFVVEPSGNGQGTAGRFEAPGWNWPPVVTLSFVMIVGLLVAAIYFREAGNASRRLRLFLAVVRLSLVGLALLMLAQWRLTRERQDNPYIAIMVDDSGSMSLSDRYEEKSRAALEQRVKRAGFNELTRLNLAKTLLLEQQSQLLKDISQHHKLKLYFASDGVRAISDDLPTMREKILSLEATGESTRLGQDLHAVLNDLRGAPPAAVILLTDGITTEGETLSEAAAYARRKAVPLFTIGIGQQRGVPDLELTGLSVDEVVYVEDLVSFEAKLRATGFKGRTVNLRLLEAGKEVQRQAVTIEGDDTPKKVRLLYRPMRVGDFEYTLEVESIPEEASATNNQQRQHVSVRKTEAKVLLVQQYPNYEYRFLKQMLERQMARTDLATAAAKPIDAKLPDAKLPDAKSPDAKSPDAKPAAPDDAKPATGATGDAAAISRRGTIDLKTVLLDADAEYRDSTTLPDRVFPVRKDDLFQYDVLIFGDVDPAALSKAAMQNIVEFVTEQGRGVVFIAGAKFTPQAYRGTPLAPLFPCDLLSIKTPSSNQPLTVGFQAMPTPLGLDSPALQLGDSPKETRRRWESLAPLYWMVEAPDLKPAARVLAENPAHRDKNGRPLPLLILQYAGAGKVLFQTTDETWRWRKVSGEKLFERYWLQTIRLLSHAKLGSHSAEITVDRREFRRGDPVSVRVRFTDDRLAPVADDGVTISIDRDGREKSQLKLQRDAISRGLFEGQIANPPLGRYRIGLVEPNIAGQTLAEFNVMAAPGEFQRTQTDVTELRHAAEISAGHYYDFADAEHLLADLPPGRPVPTEPLQPVPLWNKSIVLIAFLSLLVTEWILRKRHGML